MKVFVIKRRHILLALLVYFVLCGIISIFFGVKYIPVNVTPATNKIVILDAGHGAPDYRDREPKWYNRTRVEFSDNFKITGIT